MSTLAPKLGMSARLLMGAAIIGGFTLSGAMAAVDNSPTVPGKPAVKVGGADAPGLRNMVEQGHAALRKGDVRTAIIYFKNAVNMAPKNGQVRAELGYLLLRTGDAASAERELRQARTDGASDTVVLPSLLQAMLTRKKEQELLEQFAEPAASDRSTRAADILRARAIAHQKLGKPALASSSMERSLSIRRDAPSLLTRASLAQQQNDLAVANKATDDALKLAPTDAGALMMKISLLQAMGDDKRAIDYANQLVKYYPDTAAPKVARIGVLLKLKQDDKAQADVNAILKRQPNLPIGVYYQAIIKARAKDIQTAWKLVQTLPPEFVRSQPAIGIAVSQIGLDAGHKETAHSVLSSVVAQYPQDVDARLRLGALRLQMRSGQQALDVLLPLKDSKDPRAMALLGQSYARLKQYSLATEYFEKANAAGLSSEALKKQLALSEMRSGRSDKAIAQLQEINDANPGSIENAGPLIAAYLQAGRYADADKIAESLVKQNKGAMPLLYRGQVAMYQGAFPKALQSFDEALKIDPKFAPARFYRAQTLTSLGDSKGAQAELSRIVAQDPKSSLAFIKMAQLAIQDGRDSEVVPLLQKAAAAAPKDVTPNLVMATYQLSKGNYKQAQAAADRVLKISPNNDEATAVIGQVQFAQGLKDQSLMTFRRLVTRLPRSSGAQLLLGNVLASIKDTDGAVSSFSRAIELDPASIGARNALIDLFISTGDKERAMTAARDYAKAYPGPNSDMVLADTFIKLKRPEDAKAHLAKSYAAKPDASVMMAYVRVSMATGDHKRARELLSNWLSKNPKDVDAMREYGSLLLMSGDEAGSLQQFEAVLKARPYDVISLNNVAWLIQKKDLKRAITLVERAVKIQPNAAAIIDTLGWLKWQANAKPEALDLLQRAHKLAPQDPDIAYHLVIALDGSGKRNEAKALLTKLLGSKTKFTDREAAQKLAAQWK